MLSGTPDVVLSLHNCRMDELPRLAERGTTAQCSCGKVYVSDGYDWTLLLGRERRKALRAARKARDAELLAQSAQIFDNS